jgi:myo-inositol 2-dehydrogenase / D-chiro-inositol 1-dehydrogenase
VSTSTELRVGVVGAGMMGADHIERLAHRIAGATVSAVIEPDAQRAAAAAATAPGSRTFSRIEDALAADAVDAVVIATPGQFHEPVLLPALEAGLPILCEKPLTQDPASSWRVLEAEQKLERPVIQVGFMRRFDEEYQRLRELVATGGAGELLMLRCVHRNPSVGPGYTQQMLITDSVVHEFDIVPWLAGSDIHSVEVRYPRRNSLAPERLREPILVLIELDNGVLVDVEMNVSVGFGYQVATEAVFERGVARIGQPAGLQLWQDAQFRIDADPSFTTRFRRAYDTEVQAWVDGARAGRVAGPTAWDGYRVALACEAGVTALSNQGSIVLQVPDRPEFYA